MDSYGAPAALGILYAEDFGAPREKARSAFAPAPAAAPALTQADVDAACMRAVQAAQLAWSGSAEDRRTEALASLAASLAEARQEADRQQEILADAVARTALSLLAGALPHLCRRHGDDEVRALVEAIAPVLAPAMPLVIRAHPELIGLLADDIATLDEDLAARIELRPANLAAGDVRITWDNGSLTRDTEAIRAALQDGLAACGLLDPLPTTLQPAMPTPGRLEHAQ